jgi:YVTN family beta-propeller protein
MITGANTSGRRYRRPIMLIAAMIVVTAASTRLQASQTGTCGGQATTIPFDDVLSTNVFFCSIAEAFFAGLTNGTSSTTYSPSANVPREQMAAFVTRTLDQAVKRSSRRLAQRQTWTTQTENNLGLTSVGTNPKLVESDGADLWVANFTSDTVSRVSADDGRLLETWTGATNAISVLVAMGKVFITGETNPGSLFRIDPAQAAGAVTTLSSSLGANPVGIAFDGQKIWTANLGAPGSVSIISLNPTSVTTVTTGFNQPIGIVYDGANIWVTDRGDERLKKLDESGNILQAVTVGTNPRYAAFDGTNLWVPNDGSNTVSVVRASTGAVLATLSGNGLQFPYQAAFDGERVLVTNFNGDSVSLWKASDITPIGTFPTGSNTHPQGACSDGLNFWLVLQGTNKLAQF